VHNTVFTLKGTNSTFNGPGGSATAFSTGTASLKPIDIKFMKPDSWEEELEPKQVILFDEKARIAIRVPMPLPNLAKFTELLGDALKLKTFETKSEGVDITLNAETATFVTGSDYSEVRIELTRQKIRDLGLIPSPEADDVTEKSWFDIGAPSGATSNLSDGEAFDAELPGELRGRSTRQGTLYSEPPNSPLHKSFVSAAGAEIITATFAGHESKRHQIGNQADVFYFSGHGQHSTGKLQVSADGESPVERIGASEVQWDQDLDIAIISGCSILDIKDFRVGGLKKFQSWRRRFTRDTSPGEQWVGTGPKIFLGYCWTAPTDSQGADHIIRAWASLVRIGVHPIQAWKQANDFNTMPRAINACAINVSVTPHEFWFWNESGPVPMWTKVTKGASGW
jgi:hypothetical protein